MKPAIASLLVLLPCSAVLAQTRGAQRVIPLGSDGKRVALVVGNDAYRSLPRLANGTRDAKAVGAALSEAGFRVTLLTDAAREALEAGVNNLIDSIQPGDVALFYYSGHAVQIGADNYLAPVDLTAVNEVQARGRTLRAGEVVEEMESKGADLQIVILDACRDNPFGRERSIGSRGGLAAMNAGKGTFLAYATAPGRTADDNSGGSNGLYTTYLLESLKQPGLKIEEVFKQVTGQVQRASGGRQVPWVASSLEGDFYFRAASPASNGAGAARLDAAGEAWALVKDSQSSEVFDVFVQMFPSSDHLREAQLRAAQLRPTTAVAPRVNSAPNSPGATKMNPKDGLTYVWIPPGRFTMGCSPGDSECGSHEKPAHEVALTKGFWMGQTEVTQEAYQRVIGKNPSHFKGAKLPVETVSWTEAQAYCKAVGMRLPTEAQWEYAARGGSATARYGSLDDIAWYDDNSEDTTHAVGQKRANEYGLYDMLGNVWEWTGDWDSGYASSPTSDPSGPTSGTERMLRGGYFGNHPGDVRDSGRDPSRPGYSSAAIGVRCAGE